MSRANVCHTCYWLVAGHQEGGSYLIWPCEGKRDGRKETEAEESWRAAEKGVTPLLIPWRTINNNPDLFSYVNVNKLKPKQSCEESVLAGDTRGHGAPPGSSEATARETSQAHRGLGGPASSLRRRPMLWPVRSYYSRKAKCWLIPLDVTHQEPYIPTYYFGVIHTEKR